MAVLCLLAGGGSDQIAATIPVPDEGGLIGRAEHAAIQVLEPSVSREHAKLSRTPMGWLLQALDGANPVRVGDELLGELNLESGDVITLGEVRLRFENNDPNIKSTVVLGDWQPPSAVRRRLEAPPSAFEPGDDTELDDPALRPPEGHVSGRTTQRPKRIMPGPKTVGGFSPVDTGLQAPVGLGAAPPIESDFNREVGQREGEAMRALEDTAADRARATRKRAALQYAGWIVAGLLLLAVVALLLRG